MAEAIVGLLIGKIGEALANEATTYGASLLCTEASALKGLFGEIGKAEEELKTMKAYLYDMEKFKETSETTGIFVKKIRDLAFKIEDVVDEFTYKLEDKHGGFAAKIKKRIKQVKTWRRLALELGSINAELKEATERRIRYTMPGYIGGSLDRPTHQISTFARKEDLVGIENKAEQLKQWLVGDMEEWKHKIVTVCGMGGVGKTTLVDHVYKIVKDDFDVTIWVTVSKSYQVEDLLKKIATGLGIKNDNTSMEMRSLGEVIYNYLHDKKYIMVLDDVWETDVWINIMNVFPANCISRIIMTSRHKEVASLATSGDCIMELELLEERDSWKLFCNVVFRNNHDKSCPIELQNLAAKFLEICEGLPLAITCIGHLLFFKPPTHLEWKRVYDNLRLHSAKHVIPGVDIILKVSLEDLPYELKNCFLHCALFPEDFEIKRRRLMRHWIASGFTMEQENKTREEVAEGYLNELVNRSLLQVVERNAFGRLKSCRMHDVIRKITLNKAGIEGFGQIYEGSMTFSANVTRRLSIESIDIAPLDQFDGRYLRSIYAFTSYINIDMLNRILSSSMLLSVLDLQGTQIKQLPNVVFSLFNLRFLGLRDSGVEVLPEAVGRLVNLEVLDALHTGLLSLPKGVSKLRKLMFLYACPWKPEIPELINLFGTEMPRGIGNLTGLYTLQRVKASIETLCDVAALSELRTFTVCNLKSDHSSNLCSAIMNMSHLNHLEISASNENEILPLEALSLPETLSKLWLWVQLEKKQMPQLLSSWSHLRNLKELYLGCSKLDEDSFSSLMVLRGLSYLGLYKAYDGKKLCFPEQSFPRLRRLRMRFAPRLKEVEIANGALVSLVVLIFKDCPELKNLPRGIEFLTALEQLYLHDTAEDLIEKLMQKRDADECNEELMKISHIRKVMVELTAKNIREIIR